MTFKIVLWTKVASVLEGLKGLELDQIQGFQDLSALLFCVLDLLVRGLFVWERQRQDSISGFFGRQ